MSAYIAVLTRSHTMSFLLHLHTGGHSLEDRGGVSLASALWGMDGGRGRSPFLVSAPSTSLDGCGFFNFVVVRLSFNSISDSSE